MVQFRAGGHAYLFLCYGINVMLNVVADKAGVGAAVLIRACSPVSGDYPISICTAVEEKYLELNASRFWIKDELVVNFQSAYQTRLLLLPLEDFRPQMGQMSTLRHSDLRRLSCRFGNHSATSETECGEACASHRTWQGILRTISISIVCS